MAWTLIASAIAGSVGGANVSVGPLNCVGADLLVAFGAKYSINAPTAGELTDDSSNTWVLNGYQAAAGDALVKLAGLYVLNPTVDSSVNFLYAPSQGFGALAIFAFSGLAGSPSVNGVGNGTGTTSIQAGSLGSANDLVVEGVEWYSANGMTIDSGFATPLEAGYLAANNLGLASSYKSVTGAVNPTWTCSSAEGALAAIAMSFTGTAAASAALKRNSLLSGLGSSGPFFQNPLG